MDRNCGEDTETMEMLEGTIHAISHREQIESDEAEEDGEKCICCMEILPKYKCPTCYLKYCSVKCCKDHKVNGTCVTPSDLPKTQETFEIGADARTDRRQEEYEFPTKDTVPVRKLYKLARRDIQVQLKHFLSSKTVRDTILRLDICEEADADREFESVMKCTEFAEFAAFATDIVTKSDDEEDQETDDDV